MRQPPQQQQLDQSAPSSQLLPAAVKAVTAVTAATASVTASVTATVTTAATAVKKSATVGLGQRRPLYCAVIQPPSPPIPSFLTMLPDAVRLHLLSAPHLLSARDVCRCAQVSLSWYGVCCADTVWVERCAARVWTDAASVARARPADAADGWKQQQQQNSSAPSLFGATLRRPSTQQQQLPPPESHYQPQLWKRVYASRHQAELNWQRGNYRYAGQVSSSSDGSSTVTSGPVTADAQVIRDFRLAGSVGNNDDTPLLQLGGSLDKLQQQRRRPSVTSLVNATQAAIHRSLSHSNTANVHPNATAGISTISATTNATVTAAQTAISTCVSAVMASPAHADIVYALRLRGDVLATASKDGTLKLWTQSMASSVGDSTSSSSTLFWPAATAQVRQQAPSELASTANRPRYGHRPPVTCVDFTQTRAVAGLADGSLTIWSAVTGELTLWMPREFPDSVAAVSILATGCDDDQFTFLAAGFDGSVQKYRAEFSAVTSKKCGATSRPRSATLPCSSGSTNSSPERPNVLNMQMRPRAVSKVEPLSSSDCPPATPIFTVQRQCRIGATDRSLFFLSAAADGGKVEQQFVTGGTDTLAKLWSVAIAGSAAPQLLRTFQGHTDTVTCAAFHQRLLATGSLDKTVKLWNIETGECFNTLTGHSQLVKCVELRPVQTDHTASSATDDQVYVVSAAFDGHILVTAADCTTGTCTQRADLSLNSADTKWMSVQCDPFCIVASDRTGRVSVFDFSGE